MHNAETDSSSANPCTKWFSDAWNSIRLAMYGWKLYINHSVCFAGMALACFYMTVLGFDNITYGFALAQCITESVLGALVGVSAIFGILGSLTFPVLRKRLGLNKTGLIGMCALISMLALCVVSIWLDGSPFDPFYFQLSDKQHYIPEYTTNNYTLEIGEVTKSIPFGMYNETNINANSDLENSDCYVSSFLSVSVLIAGIILARFGLWISDLTITQILQESI